MVTLTKQAALKAATKPLLAGKATAKAATAAPARSVRVMRALGGENVVDVLTRQHRQIKRGFLQAALPGPWRRRNFDRLMRLLAVHEAAEEAHVHPVARKALQHGRELAARRREEEKQAKELLIALWRTGPDGAGYLRRLNDVRRAVTQHAAREEREEFQALRKAVSLPRLRMLGAEVKLTQAYAPTRPHRLINNEAANKLAAPILGPVDRMLDAVHRRATT
ncbi:hemerythrin domain-containing protein [Streptomyces sp. NPDC048192]|jgi:hemerythrin superfamily protein|uniref:hemerythrin domain-containing protein n=1 Tax=unclassified Streptomyces TaxID=2593676 RepID=UPI0037236581